MTPYYEDDSCVIYHGDAIDLAVKIAEASGVDLVLTDPPYGVDLKGKVTKHSVNALGGYASHADTPEFVLRDVVPLIGALRGRVGRVILTPGCRMMFAYPEPDHAGAIYYPAGAGLSPWGFTCYQPIFYYGKDPYAGKGSRPDSFHTTDNAVEVKGHPCPKPLSTMTWLLNRASADPADVVLDPFMGSGTTLIAAKQEGRRSIGIEIEERYCEIAANRLAQGVLDFGGAA